VEPGSFPKPFGLDEIHLSSVTQFTHTFFQALPLWSMGGRAGIARRRRYDSSLAPLFGPISSMRSEMGNGRIQSSGDTHRGERGPFLGSPPSLHRAGFAGLELTGLGSGHVGRETHTVHPSKTEMKTRVPVRRKKRSPHKDGCA
jgi:hypothetical protein